MPSMSDEEHDHREDGVLGAGLELRQEHDDEHDRRHRRADRVDDAGALHPRSLLGVALEPQVARPVPHHADLARGERDEHPDDVELDQRGDLGLEHDDEDDGRPGEDEDAVAEGEPVAAGVHLAGQVAVAREDRAEHREAVERGVGGEDEDQAGDDRDEDDPERGSSRRPPRRAGRSRVCCDVGVADRLAVAQQLGRPGRRRS